MIFSQKNNILLFTLLTHSFLLPIIITSEEYEYLRLYNLYLKADDLDNFKKVYAKQKLSGRETVLKQAALRKAAHAQANKIVNFLIDSGSFDINNDPATLTWFALYRPQDFSRLINKLKPSKLTMDYALYFLKVLTQNGNPLTGSDFLLQNIFFGIKPKKTEIDQAKKLLLSAGAHDAFIPAWLVNEFA